MSYEFVENRYPYDDPNTDLNFNNDILYRHVVDDDYKDYTTPKYSMGNVKPHPANERNRYNKYKDEEYELRKGGSSESIYVWFIVCAILILLVWYIYSNMEAPEKDPIIHGIDTGEMVVLSADMGNFRALIR